MTLEEARKALETCGSDKRLWTLARIWETGRMTANDWLHLLGQVWTECDDLGFHSGWLVDKSPLLLAQGDPTLQRCLMTADEWAELKELKGKITIWRGCYGSNAQGLSWSLDRKVAANFPRLQGYQQEGEQPLLIEAEVRRKDIIALKLCREEYEVIACPPRIVSVTELEASIKTSS